MKQRVRRTMMFLPANNASMLNDAYIYKPDSIMIDLEDSIAISKKDEARMLAHYALKMIDYKGIETVVRINSLDTPFAKEDINAVVSSGVDVIRLPKTDSKKDVLDAINLIQEAELRYETGKQTLIMAAIESPLGLINSYDIAASSCRMMGIALGGEDYVTNLGVNRTKDGKELFYARSKIVAVAKSVGIACFDTVYSDLSDMQGFEKEVRLIKQLGFDGKSVIHPNQIDIVNKVYTPSSEEIENAKKILEAIKEQKNLNNGVITINGKMVDKPIITRALKTIELYQMSNNIVSEDIYDL